MRLYPKSKEEADRLTEDYRFLGYETSLDNNVLTVWKGSKKKKSADKPDKAPRNKRLDRRKRD